MKYLTVALIGLLDLGATLPPAVFLKLEPAPAAAFIALASSLGVLVTVYLATAFRLWLQRKVGRGGFVGARTERFMAKYGTPGLGLLSPFILGPVLTCAGAVALGARPKQLAAYAVAGVCLWSVVIYVLLFTGSVSGLLHR